MTVKDLIGSVSLVLEIAVMGVGSIMELFKPLAIALFIVDGIKAKKQNRKRKAGFTAMFIIAIILDVLATLIIIFFFVVLYMAAAGKPWPFK
jgi:hypothetical protein